MAKPIIITGRVPQPWRMLIHGVEGIGKSTFASRAPKPIFITTEDGTNELECDKFKRCTEEWEFNDCLQFLELEQHDYQTVVVDSLDWLERLWSDALGKEGIKAGNNDFGKYYVEMEKRAAKTVEALERIRRVRDMNILLIAHTKTAQVTDPLGQVYDQFTLALEKKVAAVFKEWVDMIGFAGFSMTKTPENSGRKERSKPDEIYETSEDGKVVKNVRCLLFTGEQGVTAKCRYPSTKGLDFTQKIALNGKTFFPKLHEVIWN